MPVRVGLNGFGRTGRSFLRAIVERDLDIDVAAINDVTAASDLARLLARDTVHGPFAGVAAENDRLMVRGRAIRVLNQSDPALLPWRALDLDLVVEASGRFTAADKAAAHLAAGAPRVVVSAPCKGADATLVVGINESTFDPDRHHIVSNASCTTNCLVPWSRSLTTRSASRRA